MANLLTRRRTFRQLRPDQIAGLEMWMNVPDITSLTFNGSAVSQARDVSGQGRHIAQATGGLQPIYLPDGINGMPALRGDGVDDIMTWTTFASGTNHNFYIVAAFDTIENKYTQFGGFFGGPAGNPAGHQHFQLDNSANPGVDSRQDGYSPDYRYIPANNAMNIRSGVPAVHSFYRNGGNYGAKWTYGPLLSWTRTGGAATLTTASNRIFCNYFASGFVSFRISELVCYSRDLSDTEEASLSRYFQSRYGVGI